MSDWCVLSAIVCLQRIFLTLNTCVSFNSEIHFDGGEIGAMGACLFASHQETNSSCSPHLQRGFISVLRRRHSLLSSKTLRVFRFYENSVLIRLGFFVLFCLEGFLGGQPGGRFVLISFRFPQETWEHLISLAFDTHSPSSLFSFHRHLLAGSSVSVSLLCGHFRRSCVSHECFFQSIHINRDSLSVHTLCPTHTSSVPLPSAHNPDGV